MAPDICVRVGRRIIRFRNERGLQQDQLADHAGLSRTALSRIENGKAEPGLRTLYAIAQALGVTIGELIGE